MLLPSCDGKSDAESESSDEDGPAPSTPRPTDCPPITAAQNAALCDEAAALGYRARQHFNASAREAQLGRDLLTQALSWPPAVAAIAIEMAGLRGGGRAVCASTQTEAEQAASHNADQGAAQGTGEHSPHTAQQGTKRRAVVMSGTNGVDEGGR